MKKKSVRTAPKATAAPAAPAKPGANPARRAPAPKPSFFNRENAWVHFNRRVLALAENPAIPLLERVRFLTIVSSNLDEFYEIRVAGLLGQIESGVTEKTPDGMTPRTALDGVLRRTRALVADQYRCWTEKLTPALRREKLVCKTRKDFTKADLVRLETIFERDILPVLTPLAVDPSHPFPQLANKGIYVLVSLGDGDPAEGPRLAIVPVPRILPRIMRMDDSTSRETATFTFLSYIIESFIGQLFPGDIIHGAWSFRITRNSDLYIDEDEGGNLLKKIEEEIRNLRKGDPVRLEISTGAPDEVVAALLRYLSLDEELTFRVDGPVNLLRLNGIFDIVDRPDLCYRPFTPVLPEVFAHPESVFERIAESDRILHHPYESFAPVVDFIRQAAHDPQVYAIKQTLYRTGADSPIVDALREAAIIGKQVTVLVELKARFDELNNIGRAKVLEEAGVHVVYGLVGLKTHCKCTLVVRREATGLRRYAHLGTGNYNHRTARIYTDLSLFTADPAITAEISELFNTLTGTARRPDFETLLVAPFNLHTGILERIRRETTNARAGKPARIIAKLNTLIDVETINALYEASRAGVKTDLVIRGVCALVPGVPGMSENIRVRSILGRFLEHSRIFYFENSDKEPDLLVGSADWMTRNFVRRIECVFPVRNPALRTRIVKEILGTFLADTRDATELAATGEYLPVLPAAGEKPIAAQERFMHLADREAARRAKLEPPAAKKTLRVREK